MKDPIPFSFVDEDHGIILFQLINRAINQLVLMFNVNS